ncbi:MAG: TetR/AcrR family transcriptional regulator [Polyangiaceae bacterium]|nr:TetR/AcrR family transcriptional regulator [Polyangiaceae bacterium]
MNTAENATQAPTDSAEATDSTTGGRTVDWENPRVAAILMAAAKCFARKGFSATTLAEIGKELGLRKSIVHYYFASKAALIHEVQSFTYRKYLEQVRESISSGAEGGAQAALQSLWDAMQSSKTATGLNIEVWSAARRDDELKRRAAELQQDAQKLIGEAVSGALGIDPQKFPRIEQLSRLLMAVVNGLSVSESLDGNEAKAKQTYELFLELLRAGIESVK